MIPPITRNRWSDARWEPKIISPASSTNTSPTPVAISHSQLLCNVPISPLIACPPTGIDPFNPAAFSAPSSPPA